MTWVCFFCLEATSHLDIKAGLFILVVGGLGMSAPVQGGIGAYHYIVSQGLQLFNVSSTDGIVYATLVHTTQTLLVIVLGLWAMLKLFLIRKKNSANG
jgi:glycosyltransferase 2 family protein